MNPVCGTTGLGLCAWIQDGPMLTVVCSYITVLHARRRESGSKKKEEEEETESVPQPSPNPSPDLYFTGMSAAGM